MTSEFAVPLGNTFETKFIPFCFTGTEELVAKHFEGGILPQVGDVVELVCYEVTKSEVSGQLMINCRWRMRR